MLAPTKQLGNVSHAGKIGGDRRDSVSRFTEWYERRGEEGLREISRRKPNRPSPAAPLLEATIVAMASTPMQTFQDRLRLAKEKQRAGTLTVRIMAELSQSGYSLLSCLWGIPSRSPSLRVSVAYQVVPRASAPPWCTPVVPRALRASVAYQVVPRASAPPWCTSRSPSLRVPGIPSRSPCLRASVAYQCFPSLRASVAYPSRSPSLRRLRGIPSRSPSLRASVAKSSVAQSSEARGVGRRSSRGSLRGCCGTQVVPRRIRGGEPAGLETFVIHCERAADELRGVHDDDGRAARVGVDDRRALRAAPRGRTPRAPREAPPPSAARPSIDVPFGEHPLAVAGLDCPFHQNDAIVDVADDRADGHFRVEVEHEPQRSQTRRFGSPDFRLRVASGRRRRGSSETCRRMTCGGAKYNSSACRF